jgi:hypothetical protein
MELERAVPRRRRRTWFAITAASAVGVNLAGVALIWSSVRAPRVVVVPGAAPPPEVIAVPTTVPLVITEPAPPPSRMVIAAPPGPRATCPPPRRDAPMVEVPALDDAGVDHLVVAPTNAGWVAAWSESSLYLSYDAGARFTQVTSDELDDERSTLHDISDVTFDCYGRAIVIANHRLGIVDNRALRWVHDFGDSLAGVDRTLIGGGADIVVATPEPFVTHGKIELSVEDTRVLWRAHGNAWRPVEGLPAHAETAPVLVPGAVPSVLTGDALYTITRGKARRALAWPAPEGRTEIAPAMIDVAGRAWGIEMHGGGDCDGSFAPVLVGRVR